MSSLVNYFLLITLVVFSVTGCGKSPEAATPQPSTLNPQPSPVLRLHWLGKKRLSAEANATNFISIWNMPESYQLERQTLDKLATAPWRLIKSATPLSNAPVALLRPLLDDLVQEESYLEIISATNQPTEAVFAIKLPSDRAALWQTNLPLVLRSLSAKTPDPRPQTPDPHAFDISLETLGLRLELTRSGDWTVLSLAPANNNQLATINLLSRLTATGSPFAPTATNNWIAGDIDFAWLKRVCGWQSVADAALPRADFRVIGTGDAIRTSAKFTFPTKAPIELEPWNIPTNLVHDPLIGFTTARGFRPLLKSFRLWDEATVGEIPNQVVFWNQEGNCALRFFAFPVEQRLNQMSFLSKFLVEKVNPQLAVNPNAGNIPLGSFEPDLIGRHVRWKGVPFFSPNLRIIDGDSGKAFISGGAFQNILTNRPMPNALISQFQAESNLIFYNWEITQSSTYNLIQLTQMSRFIFGRARFSMTKNLALPWLVAVAPRLGNALTDIRLTDVATLDFTRTSTIGLTSSEIHLLAEWLESPSYPKNLFTLDSAPVPPIPPK